MKRKKYGLKRLYMVISVTVMAAEFGDYKNKRMVMEDVAMKALLSWYRLRDWNASRELKRLPPLMTSQCPNGALKNGHYVCGEMSNNS